MVTTLLWVLLLAPWLSAPLLVPLGRRLGPRVGWAALVAPLVAFAAGLGVMLAPQADREAIPALEWVPQLGARLSFLPDGLGLFFALLVTGVGVLVTLYATFYLDGSYRGHGRFYAVLQLFMGAMLWTVLSGNLLVLFIAWELTGITSFFLIGFLNEKEGSRRGARMALVTTASTGLVLMVGVILLGQLFGTFELREIFARAGSVGDAGLLTTAFLCCFVGIAGKSALFPFSYWLPNAMAAPTPVSAFLHSATMVKLGVFLTARMFPVFGGLDLWMPVLLSVGLFTFVFGAALAYRSNDLKAVLAYTTVAQLGALVAQYGWGSPGAPVYGDILHILNHTLYKACLFMVVGVIDHATGTRDLRELRGLFRRMPLTGVVAMVGLAAMAGLPLTSGFISKELLLEGSFGYARESGSFVGMLPLLALLAGSLLHVLIALRVARAFFGELPADIASRFHAPGVGLQLPATVLAGGALFFGLFPSVFGEVTAFFSASPEHPHLALWHGVTPVLLMSLGLFAAAGVLFTASLRWGAPSGVPRWLQVERLFEALVEGAPKLGQRLDRLLGFTRPSRFLVITVAALAVALLANVVLNWEALLALRTPSVPLEAGAGERWIRWGVVALIAIGALLAARLNRPIPQLFAVSAVGLGVSFFYVLYRAPDLALTQLLVETATLLMVLLLVVRFKRGAAAEQPVPRASFTAKGARIGISVAMGLVLGLGVLVFPNPALEHAGDFYLEQSLPLAKGTNAVNTVVVDFRGFDTMLEISVLLIAALGCLGLLARRRSDVHTPEAATQKRDLFPVPRDFILKAVVLLGVVPLNLLAAFIFFRGHDAPGGGFVAGLVSGLSLVLLVFVSGLQRVQERLRVNPAGLAVLGVGLAVLTALLPLALGLPLLTHLYTSIGGLTLGTPMLFDLGVYLTVVGVTLKLVFPLMKSVHGLPAFDPSELGALYAHGSEPIDAPLTPQGPEPDPRRVNAREEVRSA